MHAGITDAGPTSSGWILERRWGQGGAPLPVVPILKGRGAAPLQVTEHLTRIVQDVAWRVPSFAHIRPKEILVSFTPARNRSRYGLQARLTPMRFRRGHLTKRQGQQWFQVQRYWVDGREMLYLVTFCLPRFLDQTFDEKLLTIFHELHHIHEEFNGDIRRFPGRYQIHSRSKEAYDDALQEDRQRYLTEHPRPELLNILHYRTADLKSSFSEVVGVRVPRPKMIPLGRGAAWVPLQQTPTPAWQEAESRRPTS